MHWIQKANKWIPIQEGEFWIYHVRVKEEFRGNNVSPFVYSQILNIYKDLGFSKGWIYTSKKNDANIKGVLKNGFEKVATFHSLEINNQYILISSI